MTVDEFREALDAMTFTGGLGMWKPRVFVIAAPEIPPQVPVHFAILVPHRDGARGGLAVCEIARTQYLAVGELAQWDLRRAIEWARAELLTLITHELDEGLLVEGVRVFDPHSIEEATSAFARASRRLEDRQRQAVPYAMNVDEPLWKREYLCERSRRQELEAMPQAQLEALLGAGPGPLRSGRDYREELLPFIGLDLGAP